MWEPTHLKVTVKQAKNLLIKGKNGTNDPFVVIGIGKEKFQTSVKEKTSSSVEWREECELAIPSQGNKAVLQLTVYHHNSLGIDEFLGQVQLPLKDLDFYERPKYRSYKLNAKPDKLKKKPEKERGELEVMVHFTVKAGEFLEPNKKDKHKTSLSSLKHSLGGSLMSIGSKEKQGLKKFAKSITTKMDKIAKPKHKKKAPDQVFDEFNNMQQSQQRYGEADPGVYSEDEDDEFRFDDDVKVDTRASSPHSSTMSSSYTQDQGMLHHHDDGTSGRTGIFTTVDDRPSLGDKAIYEPGNSFVEALNFNYNDPGEFKVHHSKFSESKVEKPKRRSKKDSKSSISSSEYSLGIEPVKITSFGSSIEDYDIDRFMPFDQNPVDELNYASRHPENIEETRFDAERNVEPSQPVMDEITLSDENVADINDTYLEPDNHAKEKITSFRSSPDSRITFESFIDDSAKSSQFFSETDEEKDQFHSVEDLETTEKYYVQKDKFMSSPDMSENTHRSDSTDSAVFTGNYQEMNSVKKSGDDSSSYVSIETSPITKTFGSTIYEDSVQLPNDKSSYLRKFGSNTKSADSLFRKMHSENNPLGEISSDGRQGSLGRGKKKQVVSSESFPIDLNSGSDVGLNMKGIDGTNEYSPGMIRTQSMNEKRISDPFVDEWERKLYGRSGLIGSQENMSLSGSRTSLTTSVTSSMNDIEKGDSFHRLPEVKALTLERKLMDAQDEDGRKSRKKALSNLKNRFFHNKAGSRERLHDDEKRVVEGGNDRLPRPPTRPSKLPQEIHDKFAGKSREDLLELILNLEANYERQCKHTQDLQEYIENLLVRVMDQTPHLLQGPILKRKGMRFGSQ